MSKPCNARPVGKYASGAERQVAEQLAQAAIPHQYENSRIPYIKEAEYIPDFQMPPKPEDQHWSDYRGIVIEVKGWFQSKDRTKHLCLKEQYPNLDVRFVFSNPNAKYGTKPKPGQKDKRKTYADWCEQHGFKWAKQFIPASWLAEARELNDG